MVYSILRIYLPTFNLKWFNILFQWKEASSCVVEISTYLMWITFSNDSDIRMKEYLFGTKAFGSELPNSIYFFVFKFCSIRIKFYVDKSQNKYLDGSPGLVVVKGDSWSEGRGFKNQHRILDRHLITLICCKTFINVCLKKTKN